MNFVTVGTYDQTAYYETRLVLALIGVVVSLFLLVRRRESRHAMIFLSGGLLMAAMEYLLQREGLRGDGYVIAIFGRQVTGISGPLVQGFLDGGMPGLMALWFADLRTSRAAAGRWGLWAGMAALVLGLAALSGRLAAGQVPTSIEPVFSLTPIVLITTMIFFSLLVAWRKDAIVMVANFYAGLLIITLLNTGPLHLFGARYIGVVEGAGVVQAGLVWQIAMTTLNGIFELAGGKIHFLTIPLSLGLVAVSQRRQDEATRLSYQDLQSLTNRGWRRKSKPFRRNAD